MIENKLNEESDLNAYCCQEKDVNVKKMQQTEILTFDDVKFFIVVLSRGVDTLKGYNFSKQKISITDEINIRYASILKY